MLIVKRRTGIKSGAKGRQGVDPSIEFWHAAITPWMARRLGSPTLERPGFRASTAGRMAHGCGTLVLDGVRLASRILLPRPPHRPLLMASPWRLNSARSGRGVTLCLNYPGTDQSKEIEYQHKHLMHRTRSNVRAAGPRST